MSRAPKIREVGRIVGPELVDDLERVAQDVVEIARGNASKILRGRDMTDVVTFRIENDAVDGLPVAVVGVLGSGHWSKYLAEKETREHGWLVPAAEQLGVEIIPS